MQLEYKLYEQDHLQAEHLLSSCGKFYRRRFFWAALWGSIFGIIVFFSFRAFMYSEWGPDEEYINSNFWLIYVIALFLGLCIGMIAFASGGHRLFQLEVVNKGRFLGKSQYRRIINTEKHPEGWMHLMMEQGAITETCYGHVIRVRSRARSWRTIAISELEFICVGGLFTCLVSKKERFVIPHVAFETRETYEEFFRKLAEEIEKPLLVYNLRRGNPWMKHVKKMKLQPNTIGTLPF